MHHAQSGNLPSRPRIIFFGTPEFAVPSLRALVEQGYRVSGVVTQPDRAKGRGRKVGFGPVKGFALEYGLEVLQPEKTSERQFGETIRLKNPDLLIVVAFGQILKRAVLEIPRWGAINIHASLLPKYRGAAPIQWAVLNGETETGLTAMRMDEGLDTGPILLQEHTPILPDETAGHLHDRLASLSGEFIIETLRGLIANQIHEMPQDHVKATFAPKIVRSMSFVDWNQPARAVSAFIRGLDPWPGALAMVKGKEIKLFSSFVAGEKPLDTVPGRVAGHWDGVLYMETAKGVTGIRELQIPGKRRQTASEFLRGFPIEKGTVMGS
jgi:methionyl-tRNA formyltransferase